MRPLGFPLKINFVVLLSWNEILQSVRASFVDDNPRLVDSYRHQQSGTG